MATHADPPGLDLARLAAYMADYIAEHPDEEGDGDVDGVGKNLAVGPLTAELIAGGRSNLTYRLQGSGGQAVVLRRPPLGHVLPTAHDMGREFRVIAALSPTGFPVPKPVHLCTDPDIIGAPFYLMSYVDGVVLREADQIDGLGPAAATRIGELLVQTLLRLHATDPVEVGLADFGRPGGFLERQVRRWYEQWERSKTRDLPALDQVVARLRAQLPESGRPTIVHGDFRLDNVMVDASCERILAVLDWEMATLGDPLADVGLLVVYTELAASGLAPTPTRLGPERGFLTSAELVDRYVAGAAGVTADQIGWYVALGYYKLAIISEGIHARYLKGQTVGAGFEVMGARVPELVDRAHAALGQ